jgi:hypothetical protein
LGVFDTGAEHNLIGIETADLIGIKRYPKVGYYYNKDSFCEGYLVPTNVGGVTLEMKLFVDPTVREKDHINLISATQFLRRGYHITFTSDGVRIE